jgi:hypothetical protein
MSGEGYLTYAAMGANETRLLSINTDAPFYTLGGFAKIRVTGENSTKIEFQQKINQIKLAYRYNASSTYGCVLKVVNQVLTSWTINLQVNRSSNIGRLLNATVSFHDGTSSDQVIVKDGDITQPSGTSYNLPEGAGSTVYISV